MRAQNYRGVVIEQIADRGQRGVDAGFIRDVALGIQRDVEIAANQHFFAGNLDVFNGHFIEIHGCHSSSS